MTQFDLKDSGKRQEFETGARRDTQEGKSRPDLVSVFMMQRLGTLMAKGAEKYGDRNWEKGMPASRYLASGERHLTQFKLGDTDEDHIAQALFNFGALVHLQEAIKRGILPAELWDLPDYTERPAAKTLRVFGNPPHSPFQQWASQTRPVSNRYQSNS